MPNICWIDEEPIVCSCNGIEKIYNHTCHSFFIITIICFIKFIITTIREMKLDLFIYLSHFLWIYGKIIRNQLVFIRIHTYSYDNYAFIHLYDLFICLFWFTIIAFTLPFMFSLFSFNQPGINHFTHFILD